MIDKEKVWVKKEERTQWTIPYDNHLLNKIGITKDETVLFIAGYYGTWANAIAEKGVQTTYCDLSLSLVEFARKKYCTNRNLHFVQANFANLPTQINQFDWTISFEPISARSGLLLAALRGLMNKKGFKVIHFPRELVPENKFKNLEIIAKAYECKFKREKNIIESLSNKFTPLQEPHIVTTVETNPNAKTNAQKDISALEKDVYTQENIDRLSKISPAFLEKYLKNIK